MQFNPRIGFILGILTTIEIAISSGTVSLTNVVPAMYVPYVVGWCGLLAFIGSTVMTFLHGFSSGQVGPLVPDAPLDKTIKAVNQAVKDVGSLKSQAVAAGKEIPPAPLVILAIAIAALALGYGSPAYAQTARKPTVQLPIDPLHLNTPSTSAPVTGTNGGFAQIGAQLQKLTKDIVDKAIVDVTAANVDATIRNDQIAQPCWQAQLAFMQLLPIEWVATPANGSTPAQPGPPAEIGPALGFQVARDLMEAITGNDKGSLKVACAALIGDQLNILNQVLGLVGIGAVTGLPVGL